MAKRSIGTLDTQSMNNLKLFDGLLMICRNPEPLDWYQSYNNLRPTLRRKIRPHHKILMVGCGNSSMFPLSNTMNSINPVSIALSEEMYKDGIKNIVNIDVSKVVLDTMMTKNKDKTEMSCILLCCSLCGGS